MGLPLPRVPRFSVIIAVHNAAATLCETLDSVAQQEFADYELILVDDGSSDASCSIAEAHPLPLRIIRQPASRGPGAARNHGASEARGEFLTFLDADDLWFPWTLAQIDAAIRNHPDASFISGTAIRGPHPSPPENEIPPAPSITRYSNYFATAEAHFWIGVGGVAIRRDRFLSAGGFGEWQGNAEDSHLWLRLGTEPGFLRIDSPPLFFYRQSNSSLTRSAERIAPGYLNLLRSETSGAYPGGRPARKRRRQILSRHTRAGCHTLLERNRFREAIHLYRTSFAINLTGLRFKFLLGFWPLLVVRRFLK